MNVQHKRFASICFLIGLLISISSTPVRSTAQSSIASISPLEDTTTILQNPLMGFEDHETRSTWYPYSTGYLRSTAACDHGATCGPLNWDKINPQIDTYNFNDIDVFLSELASQGKFVQFRIRNVVGRGSIPTIPAWAAAAGVTYSNGREPFGGSSDPEIDYQKCVFLDLWGRLVNALVQRYDNNPGVNVIDIGSYGWYGEWFSGKTVLQRYPTGQVYDPTDPTLQQSIDTRTRIVRMFTGGSGSGHCVDGSGRDQVVSYSYPGFKNKPVLINQGDPEDVQIGIANGAGIRFDGVGAKDGRTQTFRTQTSSFVAQTWQTKPIMGEFGSTDYAPLDSTFMQRSLCFVREFHLSALHHGFNSKPTIDLNPLFRELGYRIVLSQATYPTNVSAGSAAAFNFTWINKGTSPAYLKYPLKLYFKPAGTNTVAAEVTLPATDIRQIMPAGIISNSADFLSCPKAAPQPLSTTENVLIPSLAAGSYDLYFAFMEPTYLNPIQLALSTKDSSGRYSMGRINVGSGSGIPTVHRADTPGVYYNGVFYLRNTNTVGTADLTIPFKSGAAPSTDDLPVVGDWAGTGVDTIGVYNTRLGVFALRTSNTAGAAQIAFVMGNPGDQPIAGHWDSSMIGDGVGVYRPSNGLLYARRALTNGYADYTMVLGNPGDHGIAGDWDGNGYDSVGVFRPSNKSFYLANNMGGTTTQPAIIFSDYNFAYGPATGVPIAGDWNATGVSRVGYVLNGAFYLTNSFSSGVTDMNFAFGVPGALPIAGKWTAASGSTSSSVQMPMATRAAASSIIVAKPPTAAPPDPDGRFD